MKCRCATRRRCAAATAGGARLAGAASKGVRHEGRTAPVGADVGGDGGVRLHSIKVALHVGELVLEVCFRIDDRCVSDGEHVVQGQVGVCEGVLTEEEVFALQ